MCYYAVFPLNRWYFVKKKQKHNDFENDEILKETYLRKHIFNGECILFIPSTSQTQHKPLYIHHFYVYVSFHLFICVDEKKKTF